MVSYKLGINRNPSRMPVNHQDGISYISGFWESRSKPSLSAGFLEGCPSDSLEPRNMWGHKVEVGMTRRMKISKKISL